MEHFSDELVEKLEDLPNSEPIRQKYHNGHWMREWRRARTWLEGHVGCYYEDILPKWIALKWLPLEWRSVRGLEWTAVRAVRCSDGSIRDPNNLKYDIRENSNNLFFHPESHKLCRPMCRREAMAVWNKRAARDRSMTYYEWWCNRRTYNIISRTTRLMKEDGIWYILTYPSYDMDGKKIDLREVQWSHKANMFDIHWISKRQLNTKELRRYQVKNDVRIARKRPDLVSQALKINPNLASSERFYNSLGSW